MKRSRQTLFVVGLLALAALTWLALTHAKPEAPWLRVEASEAARLGASFEVRVTLVAPDETMRLSVDLHGWDQRKNTLGPISRAPSQPARGIASPATFRFSIPDRPELAEVRAIIYLSPSGRWGEHVSVASSEAIPITSETSSEPAPLVAVPAYDVVPEPEIPRVELGWLRGVLIGLWLIVAWRIVRQPPPARAESGVRRPVSIAHLALLSGCAIAVLNEVAGLETFLGSVGRAFAQAHGLYNLRHGPQQIGVLVTVLVAVVLAGIAIRRSHQRARVIGFAIYFVVAATAALSLHESDALLYHTLGGVPIEQLLKLAGVLVAVTGSLPRR